VLHNLRRPEEAHRVLPGEAEPQSACSGHSSARPRPTATAARPRTKLSTMLRPASSRPPASAKAERPIADDAADGVAGWETRADRLGDRVRQQRPLATDGVLDDRAEQASSEHGHGEPDCEPGLASRQQPDGDAHGHRLEHRRVTHGGDHLQERDVTRVRERERVEPAGEVVVQPLERTPMVDDQQQQRERHDQDQHPSSSQLQANPPRVSGSGRGRCPTAAVVVTPASFPATSALRDGRQRQLRSGWERHAAVSASPAPAAVAHSTRVPRTLRAATADRSS